MPMPVPGVDLNKANGSSGGPGGGGGAGSNNKKKKDKKKTVVRVAGSSVWEDNSLLDWDSSEYNKTFFFVLHQAGTVDMT